MNMLTTSNTVFNGVAFLLIVSHFGAGVMAMGIYEIFESNWLAILIALVVATAYGYWSSRTLVQALRTVEDALTRLSEGRPVDEIPTENADTLQTLMGVVNVLIARQREIQEMRGQLARRISETAAQAERNRMARDLHDSIKQQVFSMSVSAAAAEAHLSGDAPAARAALTDVRRSAQEAMVEMRAMLQQLAPVPLEEVGLTQAIRDQCEALAYRTGATVEPHISTLPDHDMLPMGAQESLFRMVQEALSNVARHARATHVSVNLRQHGDALLLDISDNGRGFDTAHVRDDGMGLGNIRERVEELNGTIEMTSAPGEGTSICICIPLLNEPPQEEDPVDESEITRLYEAIVPWQSWLTLLGGGLVFGISVGLTQLLPLSFTDRPAAYLYATGLTLAVSIAVAAELYLAMQVRERHDRLIAAAGMDAPEVHRMRQHAHVGASWMLWTAIVFIPILPINAGFPRWVPLLITVVIGLLLVWQLREVINSRARYLNTLDLAGQRMAVAERLNRGFRWVGLSPILLWLVSFTGFLTNVPTLSLLPSHPNQWIVTILVLTLPVIIGAQIYELHLFRQRKQALDQPKGEQSS